MLTHVLAGSLAAITSHAGATIDPEAMLIAAEPSVVAIDLAEFSVAPTTVLATLHRVSLDPASAAAAGVTLNEAVVMLTHAAAALDEHAESLAAADEAFGAARQSVDDLERAIRAGTAPDEEAALAALQSARSAAASAKTARDAILTTIITAATTELSNPKKDALASIRASAADWSVLPAAYRVTAHDEAAYLALRGALAAKKVALADGDGVPPQSAALLAQWSEDETIAAALTAQEAGAAMIAASWATAVHAPPGGGD